MTSPERPSDDDADLRELYAEAIAGAPSSAHPSEDAWERFATGELTAQERTRLADHLVRCAECADIFRVVTDVRAGARAIDPTAVRPDQGSGAWWSGWRPLAAAAALVIAIGGASWRWLAPAQNAPVAATATPAAPATSASPASAVPAMRAPRRWAAIPAAPAVMLPPSLTLAVRGPGRDGDQFLEAFGPAIAPYRDQRYGDAATALADVTRQFPAVAEGWFYLGVSRLLSGDAEGAVDPLRRAGRSSVVAADGAWLEAVAQERAGYPEAADTLLRRLCPAAGTTDVRACAALGTR